MKVFQDLLEEFSHANAVLHDVAWFFSVRRHLGPTRRRL